MYCTRCGQLLPEGDPVCPNCGKSALEPNLPPETPPEVPAEAPPETQPETQAETQPEIQPETQPETQPEAHPEAQPVQPEPPAKKPVNKKLWLIIGISAACVLLLVGGILGVLHLRHVQEWKDYTTDLNNWLEEREQSMELYILDSDSQWELTDLARSIRLGMDENEDIDTLEERRGRLEEYFERLAASNTEQLNTSIDWLDSQDLLFASESDLATIQGYRDTVKTLMGQGRYQEALDSIREWENHCFDLSAVYDDYTVKVSQYDISDFPKVRVYLDVTDSSGNFVDGLPASAFYVNEGRSIDGALTRATVTNAAKLNENAGISISLVADISGSMYDNMAQAKQAMSAFVNTVQFSKGDEIELTEFNQSSYICQSFTNQSGPILSSINAMQADGQTRLYDTLLSEIERVQSRSNAKCVIGFTDGYDNVSVNSAQDVVDAAVSRNVPVFLIGIGSSCDTNALRHIAQSTGGSYQNINDIGSLASVYNSIYRQEKEVYLVEYTVSDGDNFDGACYSDIYIRTDRGTGGYVKSFSFAPQDFFELMYSKFLIAGVDCATKGERHLLESGLIVTTPEAYSNPDCLAYQSEATIKSGGAGAKNSTTFLVLLDHGVLKVEPDGDGYIVYGISNYDISKIQRYSKTTNAKEKAWINAHYGEPDGSTDFRIEENRTLYEKLTMVKDADGKWKFNTRSYKRPDGTGGIDVNEVYSAVPVS